MAPKKADQRLIPGTKELIVRMYRQGLGDCFLLALPGAKKDEAKYLLIDCGVHAREDNGPARLAQVMAHLIAATGSQLDIVVATHEHADHLSGFVQKGSPFLTKDVTIKNVWFAWTEKRGDRQADRLRQKRGAARRLIAKAVEEAQRRAGAAEKRLAGRLDTITDFERVEDVDTDAALGVAKSKLGAPKSKKTNRPSPNEIAFGLLAAKAGDQNTKHCEVTEVLEVDGVENFRAYVLGPPRTANLLEKDKPSKIRGAQEDDPGGAYKEVYLVSGGTNRALELSPVLRVEADELTMGGSVPENWRMPFAGSYRRCTFATGGKSRMKWNSEDNPSKTTKTFITERYLAESESWRRIDGDWLGATEALALDLIGDTNNTSLVLAFEWGPVGSGRVLLFPGDAQVGNWLSWRDQKYTCKDQDNKKTTVSADDLLSRTLLYKVGHHGSHNATARRDPRETSTADPIGAPFGLELMNDIIAMIPVDFAAAKKAMPDPWKMPYEPLYKRLREKADRRVLRSDLSLDPLKKPRDEDDEVPTKTTWQPVPGLHGVRWRCSEDTFKQGTKGPLCYDVAIDLPE
jgi:metallo-beta-lactamase superfamily protein